MAIACPRRSRLPNHFTAYRRRFGATTARRVGRRQTVWLVATGWEGWWRRRAAAWHDARQTVWSNLISRRGEPHHAEPVRGKVNAPEFPVGTEWLNADRPLSMRDFRGKLVLLDFWTFG